MWVLAVETATDAVGVALADEAGVVAHRSLGRGRRHVETLAPAVADLADSAAVPLGELGAIGVDVGPGLFTGLRVGIATARSLAGALGIPVVPVTSLDVIARGVAAIIAAPSLAARTLVVPVVDVRRGDVAWATYGSEGGRALRAGPECLAPPEVLGAELDASEAEMVVLAGNGAQRYRDLLLGSDPRRGLVQGLLAAPPVEALALIALERAVAGAGQPASMVLPHYLREADARINWEQRLAPGAPAAAG